MIKPTHYPRDWINQLREDDEISDEEQGFMIGYLDACEEE